MQERIIQPVWMTLEKPVRERLTKVFDIPSTGVCEIFDQRVVRDGKTDTDLLAITKEKMVEYVKQDGSFMTLWELCIWKANFQNKSFAVIPSGQQNIVSPETLHETVKRYCDTCESKKGRHRKGCPKYS